MSEVRRITAAYSLGVFSAVIVLGIGMAYGFVLDHMPWTSLLPEPEPPHVSSGDVARTIGVLASVLTLFVVTSARLERR